MRERYADFGPTFAGETLEEYHDIRVAPETLRQWMIADGIRKTRAQRRKRVQQPRHRRDCCGELVQIDGSDHHWFEDRNAQLTVQHKRTMYLLEPTEQAKAAAKKRVTVVEYEDGGVSIRYRGVPLAARPFHKDGCVTQASIVDNKLLSGALTEIRKRQQQREQELVRSAKSKREKRIVRDRFANKLPPPGL